MCATCRDARYGRGNARCGPAVEAYIDDRAQAGVGPIGEMHAMMRARRQALHKTSEGRGRGASRGGHTSANPSQAGAGPQRQDAYQEGRERAIARVQAGLIVRANRLRRHHRKRTCSPGASQRESFPTRSSTMAAPGHLRRLPAGMPRRTSRTAPCASRNATSMG